MMPMPGRTRQLAASAGDQHIFPLGEVGRPCAVVIEIKFHVLELLLQSHQITFRTLTRLVIFPVILYCLPPVMMRRVMSPLTAQ
jgi:hypothetical protein